ncbi:MerR family transcriptional regulator [Paenibacillus sp. SYP-B4298]|uniref:MerR family transcriptional regulator n=1 Tax=Paenibacillus sp. SYP-B4298 TaxID=2996034 RepID=UPI0022DD01D3|nr:MerR family transcriptional regulator [Paenibacillus sp. SYP-B4298]
MASMTRGELARRTGISAATIRYYEDSGILPLPPRAANGYRRYAEHYLIQIKFIRDAQALGYSLKEIQEVLHLLGRDMQPDTLRGLVQDKIVEIDDKIAALQNMQEMLRGLLQTSEERIHEYLDAFRMDDSEGGAAD